MLPRPSSASVGFENQNNWKDLANAEVHKSKEVSYTTNHAKKYFNRD
jgi:hypothetical protein